MGIIIKSDQEIAIMRQAGRIVATVLGILAKKLRYTTIQISPLNKTTPYSKYVKIKGDVTF